ncbi:hypothetical protein Sjap_026109 [Stephania japonica]|uniref:Uncharacterized protein n=1 Tax=Stephania japonica TaxID=461633 RepID=A0AAP0E628_9MAGN
MGTMGFRGVLNPRVDWYVVGCFVKVGIDLKHGDVSQGVENPSLEAFCKRRHGDAISIPAYGVTYIRLGQELQGITP